MDGQSTGCAALASLKETQKLLMAMARHAVPQHLCSFQAAAVLFVLDAVSQNQRGISISTRCLQAVV
jgi:hypothetical protein